MNMAKIKKLEIGSKLKINEIDYKVIDVDRGVKPSEEVKEWSLQDREGNKYLLQIVLEGKPSLWKVEFDPVLKRYVFSEKNLITIHSIDC